MKFNDLARNAAKGPAPLSYGGSVNPEDLIRNIGLAQEVVAVDDR
ncbi:hypothetical protein [Variovorax gossypii]